MGGRSLMQRWTTCDGPQGEKKSVAAASACPECVLDGTVYVAGAGPQQPAGPRTATPKYDALATKRETGSWRQDRTYSAGSWQLQTGFAQSQPT
jgi:hypothetical protein